jgi:hypothetical protein
MTFHTGFPEFSEEQYREWSQRILHGEVPIKVIAFEAGMTDDALRGRLRKRGLATTKGRDADGLFPRERKIRELSIAGMSRKDIGRP